MNGCPDCADYWDDIALSHVVTERLRDAFGEHEWRELEPDVARCSRCESLLFSNVTAEQLDRYLVGNDAA